VATIVEAPTARPLTRPCDPPALETVATDVADDVQVTETVTSLIDPSLYVPTASSGVVSPTGTVGEKGETAIETSVAGLTIRVALAFLPVVGSVAVMLAVPAATPVASPPLATVATFVADEVHVTWFVRSTSEESV